MLAVIFEMKLQESFLQSDKLPNRDRVNRCFEILDEMNPYLGSFSGLIKRIQDELHRSIYSKTLTSSSVDGKKLEKIPYFVVVQRMKDLKYSCF